MNAIVFENFGSSQVLKPATIATPTPKLGEVLIRIKHTSVNPVDWKIREGYLQAMLPHVFPVIPGWDAAGEIVQVGEGVIQFQVGDLVCAYTRLPEVHWGTYAEYIALPETFLAKLPANLDTPKAAAVPLVALTAYQALHEVVKIKANDKILITAGAGGVGSFAIQFAKLAGAEVSTTAGANNHAYVKSLGAAHAINYQSGSWETIAKTIAPNGFDAVFDGVGSATLTESIGLLKSGGRVVSIVEPPATDALNAKSATGGFHFVYPDGKALSQIITWIAEGKVQLPSIDVRNIKTAATAQDENQKRHVRGKIVLAVDFQ